MILTSIESPFNSSSSDPKERAQERLRNLRYLSWCVKDCLDRGEAPIAGHGLCTTAYAEDPEHRAAGLAVCSEYRKRADLVAFYVDLRWSYGMRAALSDSWSAGHTERILRAEDFAAFNRGEWPPGATVRLVPELLWTLARLEAEAAKSDYRPWGPDPVERSR